MTAGEKGKQVQAMFDGLAPRYDLMNRVMTAGMDQRWRRFVVDHAHLNDGDQVLDLASGTGDIAFELKRRYANARVIAGDFSVGMMQHGRLRPGGDRLEWVACDAMKLPFQDACFDAVTFGYLLRNVNSIETAISEVLRVLKPGGAVVCLDTTPPPRGIMAPFIRLYLNHGLPLLGRMLAGNAASYSYLSSSTLNFEQPEDLERLFQQGGFEAVQFKRFMFGTIAVHWARKPAAG